MLARKGSYGYASCKQDVVMLSPCPSRQNSTTRLMVYLSVVSSPSQRWHPLLNLAIKPRAITFSTHLTTFALTNCNMLATFSEPLTVFLCMVGIASAEYWRFTLNNYQCIEPRECDTDHVYFRTNLVTKGWDGKIKQNTTTDRGGSSLVGRGAKSEDNVMWKDITLDDGDISLMVTFTAWNNGKHVEPSIHLFGFETVAILMLVWLNAFWGGWMRLYRGMFSEMVTREWWTVDARDIYLWPRSRSLSTQPHYLIVAEWL